MPRKAAADAPFPANENAVGHKRDLPAGEVVTTAAPTVKPEPDQVKPASWPKVDFALLRQQITMERVLGHLDLLAQLRGRGQQRRGPCPLHSHPMDAEQTFSVHLGKGAFQCFHADCAAKGNVLDLWAAIHRLPLYEAALDLAETFGLRRNRREEEPVVRTRHAQAVGTSSAATAAIRSEG
jgi:DNA primase